MLIAIEGCIAAGKTTVATGLSEFRGQPILLEDFEMNPFLRDFYQDPGANITETEFAFLLIHYHQFREQLDSLRNGEMITDFHLGKDLIFAEMNMSDPHELEIFRQLNLLCTARTTTPDVLVFLSAPTSLICKRVRERGRDFEQDVDEKYYWALNTKYEEFYRTYDGLKLRVDMKDWDFVLKPELYSQLSSLIDQVWRTGREANGAA